MAVILYFLILAIYRVSTKKVALTLEDHSTPFKIVVGIKVRGDSESAGAELSESPLTCILTIILRGAIAFKSQRKCFNKLQTSHSKSQFWHWVNFELKYLGSLLSYRKVMVFHGKLCSSTFRITPYFYSYDNFKGCYGLAK